MQASLQAPSPPPLFRTGLERIETPQPLSQFTPVEFVPSPTPTKSSSIRRPLPPTQTEKSFRHSFWAASRARVRQALLDACAPDRRIEAFDCCGSGALVLVDDETGRLRIAACMCHDRFCEACQHARRATVQRNLMPLVEQQRTLHVVLTSKGTDLPLAEQIRTLYQNAAKLRRRPYWKNRVTGGSQTLEITWNADTRQWHPHLHILCHAEWLQIQDLSAEWFTVTGDSHRVHVSLVRSTASATREVTKYLGKITHRSFERIPERLAEAVLAMKGVRLIATFGTWRKVALTAVPKPEQPIIWRILMPLQELLNRAARKEPWAMQALIHLDHRHSHPTPDRGAAHDQAP